MLESDFDALRRLGRQYRAAAARAEPHLHHAAPFAKAVGAARCLEKVALLRRDWCTAEPDRDPLAPLVVRDLAIGKAECLATHLARGHTLVLGGDRLLDGPI